MRIAQVAPLHESVPPEGYGGTERVVAYLTDALVAQGHDVTLFASGDSATSARLVPIGTRSLRRDESCRDPLAPHFVMLDRVFADAHKFDVVHFHTSYLHFPSVRRRGLAHVTTMHGRLDLPELAPLFERFSDVPLVSISDHQRTPLPSACWADTVHHGLPVDLLSYSPQGQGYLAFLGRVSPEKRLDRAIDIARAVEMPLKVAAKVDRIDREYFAEIIEPRLQEPGVEFIGEIGEHEKAAFLGGADALLFPIDWPEPFGMVMIEAMACGTPVIAWPHGSVPEVLDHGRTGFVVTSVDEAIDAVHRLAAVPRAQCRAEFERRFTAERMARAYVAIFERLIASAGRPRLEESVNDGRRIGSDPALSRRSYRAS
jgi:glycosyltransferase involved in cell wall biosynthesis